MLARLLKIKQQMGDNRVLSKKQLYLGLTAGLLAIMIILGFVPDPINVSVVRVIKGPFAVYVEEEGQTRLIDRFIISAPMAGYARRVDFKVGDKVQRGDVVIEMEPLRADMLDSRSHAKAQALVSLKQSSLLVVEAEAKAAQAEAAFARDEFARISELYRQALVSREQFQQAQKARRLADAAEESAAHAIDVARFELENAEASLKAFSAKGSEKSTISVLAPVDGVILAILHKSEGVVVSGQAMMQLGNPNLIEIQVDVLSEDAVKVAQDMPVIIERWGGEQPLQGCVSRVEPVGFTKLSALGVEEQRVNVIVDLVSPPDQWQSLGDAYRVEAKIIIWQQDDVLQVPSSAIFQDGDAWAVFVHDDGRAVKRQIQKGKKSGLLTQVISGVTESEQVIAYPDTHLRDGSRVRVYVEDK